MEQGSWERGEEGLNVYYVPIYPSVSFHQIVQGIGSLDLI